MNKKTPEAINEVTSRVMKSNKGRDTGPEKTIRAILREIGYPGYRMNWKKAPGKPDIAYPGRKIAIFVNGCFWHRCPTCNLPLPKTHTDFWQKKFQDNVERDRRNLEELSSMGWMVFTVWECELKDLESLKLRLQEFMDQ
ncbi:DNA mismatch endonuclease Vsr [methanogenic archaeon mixed culture ISO4-G1]|nr:DNA mismatch endonuclease Vsr [methanogenic archaeon mixed culture ISO4-G1]